MSIHSFFQENLDINKKKLKKFDEDINVCTRLLTDVKIRLSTLEIQMHAMRTMYKDIMELRKLVLILNPHLSPKTF